MLLSNKSRKPTCLMQPGVEGVAWGVGFGFFWKKAQQRIFILKILWCDMMGLFPACVILAFSQLFHF